MAITKAKFNKLKQTQKEKIIAALFNAKFQGFNSKSGINISVPAGYSLRIAALLTCEEEDEIVQKIFVVLEEFNDAITSMDIEKIEAHARELEKTEKFKPERDEFWVITNQKWSYEAYKLAEGKIILMDLDMLVKGLDLYYNKKTKRSRDLRDVLRHYSLVK